MNRRSFLSVLAALPFVRWLRRTPAAVPEDDDIFAFDPAADPQDAIYVHPAYYYDGEHWTRSVDFAKYR